jgi:stage III sporulation protein AD
MGIIQIAMIGIGAVALALMVKQQKSEYALYLSLSAVVLILVFSMNRLQVVMETIRKIEQYTGIDVAMLKILVKLMGITYVAEFASEICKDAGFSAIGSQIEMFAKFSIMAVSVPVLLTLLETIEGLLSTWK